jgi:hypothetical protein
MFRVKHLKDGKLSFDGTMNTEDVKKLNGMDKLIPPNQKRKFLPHNGVG